eukprot:6172727-Pleurochrysis_carterae.AAC.3
MKFWVSRVATAKWVTQRPAKFQRRAGSGMEAIPTCGLDDKSYNYALQAGLARGGRMIFDSVFTLSAEESRRATGPSPNKFSGPRLRSIVTGGTTCGRVSPIRCPYGVPLLRWRYESRRGSGMHASKLDITFRIVDATGTTNRFMKSKSTKRSQQVWEIKQKGRFHALELLGLKAKLLSHDAPGAKRKPHTFSLEARTHERCVAGAPAFLYLLVGWVSYACSSMRMMSTSPAADCTCGINGMLFSVAQQIKVCTSYGHVRSFTYLIGQKRS